MDSGRRGLITRLETEGLSTWCYLHTEQAIIQIHGFIESDKFGVKHFDQELVFYFAIVGRWPILYTLSAETFQSAHATGSIEDAHSLI